MDQSFHFDRIVQGPPPIYMGPLPRTWGVVPAPVVINMCGVFPDGPPSQHKVFALALHDLQEAEALPSRSAFEAFLDSIHVYAESTPTYWHCHAGLNRSGLALAAYLHRFHGMRISSAIALMRQRRSPLVLCNAVFERTLRSWYGGDDEQEFTSIDLDAWLVARTAGREDWR